MVRMVPRGPHHDTEESKRKENKAKRNPVDKPVKVNKLQYRVTTNTNVAGDNV